eukprot:11213865-Lingulodinium_polyedra.AAC.1
MERAFVPSAASQGADFAECRSWQGGAGDPARVSVGAPPRSRRAVEPAPVATSAAQSVAVARGDA